LSIPKTKGAQMRKFLAALRRFILKQRIEMLRSDVFVMLERQRLARLTLEGCDECINNAHFRLRKLKANLALIERPEVLLKEAIRE
jgi:hypothetical protein